MIRCAVAGATGAVGQRFLQLLEGHPFFDVVAVAGGPNRVGQTLGDAIWALERAWPADVATLRLVSAEALIDADVRVIFSALPSSQAGPLEAAWAEAGIAVFSNASSHRMDPDVPLLIAEVNPDHLDLVAGRTGFIVANGNCSGIIATLPLAALHRAFGITHAHIVTQQALSGAGIGGMDPADIHDNVIPYIRGEEEKLEAEPLKMLDAAFPVQATCMRVNVQDGHLMALHVQLGKEATWDEVEQALAAFSGPGVDLPSAPDHPIEVMTEADRPQPRLDRDAGMVVRVGRIRVAGDQVRLVVLGHNTIRGAAGQSVLNAELAEARGLL